MLSSENKLINEKEALQSLRILKEWLQKQPHLPKDFDDSLLLAFVKQAKSIEKAKKKLDAFCTHRTKSPELFLDVLDPAFKDACEFTNIFFLPKPTPEGYRVLMIKGNKPEKLNQIQINARLLMMLEVSLEMWPDMKGVIGIMDVLESTSEVLPKLNVPSILKCLKYVQEAMPMEVKQMIIINVNQVTEFVINNLINPFVKSKLTEKLVVMNEHNSIENYLPLEMLPIECGGKAPSVKKLNEEWLNILNKRSDWFLKYSKLCSDESKRHLNSNDVNNVYGSFRYLSID